MLLTKYVKVQLMPKNIVLYESLGYNIPRVWDEKHKRMSVRRGTAIVVSIDDLACGSHEKVDVKCDYCDTIKRVSYKDYLKNHDDKLGDCCVKCRPIKYADTMMREYGVANSSECPEFLEKAKETNRERYGCDWHMQRKEYQDKLRGIMMDRYGVEHALQVPEFIERATHTKHKNFSNPTSKPQRRLGALLLEMYGNCKLEEPCGRYSIDCFVEIDGFRIDVEYDGWFHHQDKERDNRRDEYMIKRGYKVLRVLSNKHDDIPSAEQIDKTTQQLLCGKQRMTIQM